MLGEDCVPDMDVCDGACAFYHRFIGGPCGQVIDDRDVLAIRGGAPVVAVLAFHGPGGCCCGLSGVPVV